ncbi:MAG: hypothetical protein OEM93_08715, partial [Rhodospirillales bacterium]|nr:hypothetical protein [Rhodospirillales bacterium]
DGFSAVLCHYHTLEVNIHILFMVIALCQLPCILPAPVPQQHVDFEFQKIRYYSLFTRLSHRNVGFPGQSAHLHGPLGAARRTTEPAQGG